MNIWMVLIAATAVSSVLCNLLIPMAWKTALVDHPCDRKQHVGPVPLVGGLAVYGTMVIMMMAILPLDVNIRLFLVAASFMVLIGALDDRYDIDAGVRFIAQMLAAAVVVFGADVQITQLGNLFGTGVIELGAMSMPFTLLCIVAAMNAYNMIDGIDGLLGALAMVAFAGVSMLALMHQQQLPLLVATILFGALIPYLIRNVGVHFRPVRKIFMGDSGSMLVGFTAVWMLVMLTHPEQLLESWFEVSPDIVPVRPVAVLWLIAVPLMDMFAIMTRRIMKGQSPFKPDREHLHHIFMRAGFSPRQTLALISGIASFKLVLGLTLEWFNVPEVIVLSIFVAIFVLYLLMLKNIWTIVSWVRQKRDIESS
ncbi:Undecaprenyl-phosphate alpha-N-acetylglucosaminyl 1-phosphate transferase [Pseudidiomarina piscicola]|uniref:Undecaprenyl-phosphate alpha-N-acetylglucosaminyl 1-phosphate transferase n=1 Tax=Pseudidiomarina piscicola TaxID=2614830 RepID=A0A6S6WRY3_9GAMM|nr:UDP-N-acetylglucosamine--undecaprenyl-phosphate N-acetylglucosaminephosphotransferase [Pseudidiomarina piscicola]CAB0151189.1 Undecaprenyl-phosphate alpha-N-acetylglucosaminyl 1-phosphate transferase [Pseudidiomarina piscicola]VZT40695.1 Undecaprenyl-phosphate alpha-N-acetylglucosaminyl 1-phosphate transferase [Pseudomonas aeruginosa]